MEIYYLVFIHTQKLLHWSVSAERERTIWKDKVISPPTSGIKKVSWTTANFFQWSTECCWRSAVMCGGVCDLNDAFLGKEHCSVLTDRIYECLIGHTAATIAMIQNSGNRNQIFIKSTSWMKNEVIYWWDVTYIFYHVYQEVLYCSISFKHIVTYTPKSEACASINVENEPKNEKFHAPLKLA